MNNLRTSPPKFLQKPSPYFFMVHLLHRLYGVDAPGRYTGDIHNSTVVSLFMTPETMGADSVESWLSAHYS